MKLLCFLPAILAGILQLNVVRAADNVHFSGALVAEPCTLPDNESDIRLDFGSVIEKSLYTTPRTPSQPFTIHLEDCDPTMMKTVSVMFEGTADSELTTLLVIDPSSTAKGIAIGLELADGSPLDINKASPYQQFSQGNNSLIFNAYVQAKPGAITQQNITPGDFTAIATFMLAYQ